MSTVDDTLQIPAGTTEEQVGLTILNTICSQKTYKTITTKGESNMSNQFKVGDTVVVVNEDGSPSKYFTRPCVIKSLVHYNNPKSVTIACPTKPDTALSAYRTHTFHGVSIKNIRHVPNNQ